MITVHVGLHKTGTTSIQAALGVSKGHIRRRQAYLRWTDLFITDGTINEAGVPRVRGLSERGWHCVVSSEGALGAMSLVYPDAAPVARRLDELLGDRDLRVVVYLRPQHDWVASAYTQHVKEGGLDHPRDYVQMVMQRPHLHYASLVADLAANLPHGRLIVRPYSGGMDVVDDFYRVVGLGPVPAYLGHLRVNESLPAEAVSALRQANSGSAGVAVSADAGRLRRSPLPEDCQADLHALFRSDWPQLAALVGTIPGHDSAEFGAVLDAADEWVPRPYAEVSVPADGPSSPGGPAAVLAPAAPPSSERFAAWRRRKEFQLRHGPRQALLRALMR